MKIISIALLTLAITSTEALQGANYSCEFESGKMKLDLNHSTLLYEMTFQNLDEESSSVSSYATKHRSSTNQGITYFTGAGWSLEVESKASANMTLNIDGQELQSTSCLIELNKQSTRKNKGKTKSRRQLR